MMPDELNPLAGSENENKPTPTTDPEPAAEDKAPKTFDEKYVQDLRKEAELRRKELRIAERERDELRAAQAKAKDDELAAQNKWEEAAKKAQQERDDAKKALESERFANLRTRIGMEHKLPTKLVDRLQGTTEDELRADAQALIEELGLNKAAEAPATPPAQTPNPARRQTTVVAPGGQPGETDDEKRARLYKQGAQNSPLFQSNE